MANPQPDKHTRISNELLEALARIRISGEARQVLDVIFRKTYGFHKKEDKVSLSQFSLATGLHRTLVVRGLSKLITLNLIIVKKDNTLINKYRINKDFDSWKPLSKKRRGVSKKTITIIKKDNLVLSKKRHTKDTLTKDTLTKESFPHFKDSSFTELWDSWLEVRKEKKVPNTKTAMKIALNKLHKHPLNIATLMLEEAIEKGWKGIYELKGQDKPKEGGIKKWLQKKQSQKD